MAGGVVKARTVYGETDDFSYNVVKDPMHIRDLNATIQNLLDADYERITFKLQGLDQKLTGVDPARVVREFARLVFEVHVGSGQHQATSMMRAMKVCGPQRGISVRGVVPIRPVRHSRIQFGKKMKKIRETPSAGEC